MAIEGTTHERMHLEEGAIVETDVDGDANFASCQRR